MSLTTLHLLFILSCSKIATQIIFFLQALWKLREAAELKWYAALLGVRGTSGAWDGRGRYPAHQALDLIIEGSHRAGEATPSPSRTLAPTSWKQWALTGVNLFAKRAHHSPTTMVLAFPEEEELVPKAMTRQSNPIVTIASPLASYTFPVGLHKGPPVPWHIIMLTLPARAFKNINLKASGKEYTCRECDKTSTGTL